ncbi:response regulator [Limnoglobus roseus]|uniref:response regulator n=1 Tax=Limnoglobus roseus TaxID=2598579 RepID=UPI0011EB125D|nr:response regulator [Limnoglobus roseus]
MTTDTDALALEYALARHDLRTPVTAIIGYAEMLLEDDADSLPPELRTRLSEVSALGRLAVTHIAALTPAGPDVWAVARQRLSAIASRLVAAAAGLATTGSGSSIEADLDQIVESADRLTRLLASGTIKAARPATEVATAIPSAIPPGYILIVDDEAANRRLLAREVQKQGHTFALAADGPAALELIDAAAFDLVLLDLMLPGMSGLECLARIRNHPTRGHTPVIFVSARDDVSQLVHCLEAGADDLVVKPCDPAILKARVGACLEKKRLRDWELEYQEHVGTLTSVAAGIEYGTFDPAALDAVANRPDALGGLARVVARTAAVVLAREEQLRREVLHLRVEVDHARRDRQVAEIAETDFMQALVARADELRRGPGE